MKDLHKNGATHLALEIDERAQPKLDEFMRTGTISDDLRETIQEYAPRLNSDDYFALLKSARDAGLQLVAVDKERGPIPEVPPGQPLPPSVSKETEGRDAFMADKIEGILKKNPDDKVVLWVGKMHAADPSGFIGSADEFLKGAYKTASITVEIPGEDTTLLTLANGASEPFALSTHKASHIAELPTERGFLPNHYSDWDYAMVFPEKPP